MTARNFKCKENIVVLMDDLIDILCLRNQRGSAMVKNLAY